MPGHGLQWCGGILRRIGFALVMTLLMMASGIAIMCYAMLLVVVLSLLFFWTVYDMTRDRWLDYSGVRRAQRLEAKVRAVDHR